MKNSGNSNNTVIRSYRRSTLRKWLVGFLAASTAFTVLGGLSVSLQAEEPVTEYALAGAGSGQDVTVHFGDGQDISFHVNEEDEAGVIDSETLSEETESEAVQNPDYLTLSFRATEGGSVSADEQVIAYADLADKADSTIEQETTEKAAASDETEADPQQANGSAERSDNAGSPVAPVTAAADENFDFVNWTDQNGDVVGEEMTFTPEVDRNSRDMVYTANFAPQTFTLIYDDGEVHAEVVLPRTSGISEDAELQVNRITDTDEEEKAVSDAEEYLEANPDVMESTSSSSGTDVQGTIADPDQEQDTAEEQSEQDTGSSTAAADGGDDVFTDSEQSDGGLMVPDIPLDQISGAGYSYSVVGATVPFDISIMENGEEVEPKEGTQVEVSLTFTDDRFAGSQTAAVLHSTEDGIKQPGSVDVSIDDAGNVETTFVTDSFSTYTVSMYNRITVNIRPNKDNTVRWWEFDSYPGVEFVSTYSLYYESDSTYWKPRVPYATDLVYPPNFKRALKRWRVFAVDTSDNWHTIGEYDPGVKIKIRRDMNYKSAEIFPVYEVGDPNYTLSSAYSAFNLDDGAFVLIDPTNGGVTMYEGARVTAGNQYDYNRKNTNNGAKFTLPTADQVTPPYSTQDDRYQYKLNGWYVITNYNNPSIATKQWYPASGAESNRRLTIPDGVEVLVYADWIGANYSVAQNWNQPVADTRSFITSYIYDYNDLFNGDSLSYNTPEHPYAWSVTGNNPFIFLGRPNNERYFSHPYNRNEVNSDRTYGKRGTVDSGCITSGIMTDTLRNRLFPAPSDQTVPGVHYIGDTANGNMFYYNAVRSGDVDSTAHLPTGEYYYYDCRKNAAAYNQNARAMYTYPGRNYTSASAGNSDSYASDYSDFLPFNYGSGEFDQNRSVNYWFGMKTDINFFLPDSVEGGETSGQKNIAAGGNDMVYYFSGDDDVWVYVDDQLLLDLGGVHDIVSGMINFSTGTVTTWDTEASGQGVTEKTYSFPISAGDHKLTMYYLERGCSQSNCAIYFNICPRYGMTITKQDGDTQENLRGAEFSVFLDPDCTVAAALWDSKTDYDNKVPSKNVFTAGTDGKASFFGLLLGHTYYLKETAPPAGYPDVSDDVVTITVDRTGTVTATSTNTSPSTGLSVGSVSSDNSLKWMNLLLSNYKKSEIEVVKKWYGPDGSAENVTDRTVTVELHQISGTSTHSENVGKSVPVSITTKYFNYGESNQNGYNMDTANLLSGDVHAFLTVVSGGSVTLTLTGIGGDAGIYSVTRNGHSVTPDAGSTSNPTGQNCYMNGRWGNHPYRNASYTFSNITESTRIVVTLIGYLGYNGATPLVSSTMSMVYVKEDGIAQGESDPDDVTDNVLYTQTLSSDNNWHWHWENLDSNSRYYIKETKINGKPVEESGYMVSYDHNSGIQSGTIYVDNVRIPTSVSGSKTWNDGGVHPDHITVKLYRNGTEIDSATVTADNQDNWAYSFSGLPMYDENGVLYSYTVQEDPVEGYSTTYDGNNIINTAFTDVEVRKVWKNEDGSEMQTAPSGSSVTFRLYADNQDTGKAVTLDGIADSNGETESWVGRFSGLDKYKNNQQIQYTVKEYNSDSVASEDGRLEINGITYLVTIEGSATEQKLSFAVTNQIDETSLQVRKQWVGDDEQAARTSTKGFITFTLHQDYFTNPQRTEPAGENVTGNGSVYSGNATVTTSDSQFASVTYDQDKSEFTLRAIKQEGNSFIWVDEAGDPLMAEISDLPLTQVVDGTKYYVKYYVEETNRIGLDVTYRSADGGNPSAKPPYGDVTITNHPISYNMPATGGEGTRMIYLLGITLMVLAGAGLILVRRRKERAA